MRDRLAGLSVGRIRFDGFIVVVFTTFHVVSSFIFAVCRLRISTSAFSSSVLQSCIFRSRVLSIPSQQCCAVSRLVH